jgi:hypothetical protein
VQRVQGRAVGLLGPAGPSALRLAFVAWIGVSTIRTPAPWTMRWNPSVHLPFRSQMRTRWAVRNQSTKSVSRRAACAMNQASGVGVALDGG